MRIHTIPAVVYTSCVLLYLLYFATGRVYPYSLRVRQWLWRSCMIIQCHWSNSENLGKHLRITCIRYELCCKQNETKSKASLEYISWGVLQRGKRMYLGMQIVNASTVCGSKSKSIFTYGICFIKSMQASLVASGNCAIKRHHKKICFLLNVSDYQWTFIDHIPIFKLADGFFNISRCSSDLILSHLSSNLFRSIAS